MPLRLNPTSNESSILLSIEVSAHVRLSTKTTMPVPRRDSIPLRCSPINVLRLRMNAGSGSFIDSPLMRWFRFVGCVNFHGRASVITEPEDFWHMLTASSFKRKAQE